MQHPVIVNMEANRENALELRKEAKTYREIGLALGISKSRAYELVSEALEDLRTSCREKARQMRDLELQRLDAMWAALYPDRKDPETARAMLRIMDRRANYLGLDAPKRMHLAGAEGGPIQTVDAGAALPLTDAERLRRVRELGLDMFLTPPTNGNGNGHSDRHN